MRIIGGTARGRRLLAPKGLHTRPTADRVREAIFNVLSARLAGAWVLDVFAGSGALGLEALSRGAAGACFLENDAQTAKTLRRNITDCAFANARLLVGDARKLLPRLEQKFDLVFLDPPYNQGLLAEIFRLLAAGDILAPQAVIVVETTARQSEFQPPPGFAVVKSSKYGDTAVHYCQQKEATGAE